MQAFIQHHPTRLLAIKSYDFASIFRPDTRPKFRKISGLILCLMCGATYAQDATFDPRSLAMGGTGVANADMSNAVFHNPAILATTTETARVALASPIVALRLLDPSNLRNDTSQLGTDASLLTNAMNTFNANNNIANAKAAGVALTAFNNSLVTINHKILTGNGFGGVAFALPGKDFAFSLYVDGRAEIAGQFNYATNDQATLANLTQKLAACNTTTLAGVSACAAASAAAPNGQVTGLQSQLLVRGVIAKDFGFAAAHHFDDLLGLDVGITPKFTQFSSYDYVAAAQSSTHIALNNGKQDFNAFNLDMGAAEVYELDDDTRIKTGLALKNILPANFTTALGNGIQINPQATVAASYSTHLFNAAIDCDAIPNKPMIVGLSKDAQYLRLGAEFDAWRWAQIRIGYRHDLLDNYPNLPSIGFAVSPFGLHLDLSIAAANKSEMAVSLQTGAHF